MADNAPLTKNDLLEVLADFRTGINNDTAETVDRAVDGLKTELKAEIAEIKKEVTSIKEDTESLLSMTADIYLKLDNKVDRSEFDELHRKAHLANPAN